MRDGTDTDHGETNLSRSSVNNWSQRQELDEGIFADTDDMVVNINNYSDLSTTNHIENLPRQKSTESTDLFMKPYAQDDLISLRSEDEMSGLNNDGGPSENDLLRPIFDAIDTEGNNYITLEKFFEEMDKYSHTPTSAKKKEKLQKTLDPDNEGVVTYPNFVTGVLMFRLENDDVLSPSDDINEDHHQWSLTDHNNDSGANATDYSSSNLDEVSSNFTNYSTNGGVDSPDSALNSNLGFGRTLTSKGSNVLRSNSNSSGKSRSGRDKNSSMNDKFRRPDLPKLHHSLYTSQNGAADHQAAGAGDMLNGDDEEVYSTYSDMEYNDDALSVSSAQNPPYSSRSPRPQSPGGNSAVDDACSHLSESDAYMLDNKLRVVDLTLINLSETLRGHDSMTSSKNDVLYNGAQSDMSACEIQIRALQQQLENYVSNRAESEATQQKLREDKNTLQNKAILLEEQLSDFKRHYEDELQSMKQNHREEKQAIERECRDKIEILREQLRDMETNSHQFKSEIPRLKGQLELLKEDKQKLEDKIETKDATINQCEMKIARLQEDIERMKHSHQQKMQTMQSHQKQLVEELEMRTSRCSSSQNSHNYNKSLNGSHLDNSGSGADNEKFSEVLQKCNSLRNENNTLQERIHELESNYRYLEHRKSICEVCKRNAISSRNSDEANQKEVGSLESLDLLSFGGPDGPNSPLPTCSRTPPPSEVALMKSNTSKNEPESLSLAAELAQVFNKTRELDVKEVVRDALEQNKSYEKICLELKQQEQINNDLQSYLGRLLLLIMESNPEILEVK